MLKHGEFYELSEVINLMNNSKKGNEQISCSLSEIGYENVNNEEIKAKLPSGESYALCSNAEFSLCRELGIPYGYYLKISNDLKLKNLKARSQSCSKERKIKYNKELGVIRGVMPTAYIDLNNDDILTFVPKNTNLKVVPFCDYEESDLVMKRNIHFKLLTKEIQEEKDLSKNYAGIDLNISELGGFFSAYPAIYRLICKNGAILVTPNKQEGFRLSYARVESSLLKGLFVALFDMWNKNYQLFDNVLINMQDTVPANKIAEIVDSMLTYRVSKRFIQTVLEAITYEEMTSWELLNFITSSAKDEPEDRKLLIESAASAVTGLSSMFNFS